jgi:phosphatidylserine decarboxylase
MPAHWAGLPIAREGYPLIVGAAGIALLLWLLGGAIGAIVGAVLFGIVLNFFRDPERIPPADERLIVAPADGRVITVAPVREDRFLKADAIKVSIFMSPLNVHVNRNPVSGAVVSTHYNHGKYFRAFAEKASLDNEQNAIVVEDKQGRRVCFVQIAGFLARRIVCYLRPGMDVERGQRCGIIKFGSRVDIYLPPAVAVQVRVGDHTTAGETVIGAWQ